MRDDKKTFAICISYQKDTRHYLIDKNQENKYGIQDGPKFECIMMVGSIGTHRQTLNTCTLNHRIFFLSIITDFINKILGLKNFRVFSNNLSF